MNFLNEFPPEQKAAVVALISSNMEESMVEEIIENKHPTVLEAYKAWREAKNTSEISKFSSEDSADPNVHLRKTTSPETKMPETAIDTNSNSNSTIPTFFDRLDDNDKEEIRNCFEELSEDLAFGLIEGKYQHIHEEFLEWKNNLPTGVSVKDAINPPQSTQTSPSSSRPSSSRPPSGSTAVVLYSYEAKNDDEITIQVNDNVTEIVEAETGWYRGKCNGQYGLFPSNFVQRDN